MRKFLLILAVLAPLGTASALGVGVYFDYNPVGKLLAPDPLPEWYDLSFIGFDGGLELRFHKNIALVTGVGFQRFSFSGTILGRQFEGNDNYVPVTFGVEFPITEGSVMICPAAGGGITFFPGSENIEGQDFGAWGGGKFYYMVNPNLGVGGGATYNYVATSPKSLGWLHVPVGIKYWFM